jgi:allophanate hydrolase
MSTQSFDFAALHAAYGAGATAGAVVAEVYRRIAQVADDGIFIHLRPVQDVLGELVALGPFDPVAKPLWGIPFAIKDNIDLAGVATTAGCPAYAFDPQRDAFVVAQLRAAGAIAIGKTNLDQFATGLVGVRSPFTPPLNAVDPLIVPGGSSSGSGVVVSHGIVSFSLGTDTAGSGRVPAALNNVVGLKPTLGALSATGVVPACRTLDTISIFALTVADAYGAFQVAAVYDPADAYSRAVPAPSLGATPVSLRIGVPDAATIEFFGDTVQEAAFARDLARLTALGHTIVPMDFTPFYEVAKMLYEGAWVGERMTVLEPLMRSNPEAIHPVTRRIVGHADSLSAADAFRGIYRLADLKRLAEPALKGVDALCVPTIPTFYSVADLEADPVGPNSRYGTYTNFVNLMDMSAIAVPTGPRTDGRPGSVTFIAGMGRDGLIARLGQDIQQIAMPEMGATGIPLPAVAPSAPAALSDEIVVAVVGAHMSGLPLNSELTTRGGRFLEETATAPEYRFYALAGGPPMRPGMLRVSSGGVAVSLELWALPRASFGDFVTGIPSPLCIGTVLLADGRTAKGFLVEASGIEGASDISQFGGWRAYCAAPSV